MITEFLRQMYEVHIFLKNRGNAAFTFPFELGIYRCKSSVDAKAMSEELSRYNLKWFTERNSYDPRGTFASHLSQNSAHVPTIEEFLANCDDEFKVRQRNFSRFTLQQMADFLLEDVEGLIDDGEEVLLPMYHEEQIEDEPLLQVNWSIKKTIQLK
jgi:hypothetical protein